MDLLEKQKHFGQKYPELFDYLYRYVCYRIIERSDAEDIVSDCFLNGYHRLNDYDPAQGSLKQWLTGIAKNQILMYWRKKKITISIEEEIEIVSNDHDTFVSDLSKKLFAERLLSKLPKEQKILLTLRYIDDLDYNQIAELVEKEPATLRKYFSRLHKKLRFEFEDEQYA